MSAFSKYKTDEDLTKRFHDGDFGKFMACLTWLCPDCKRAEPARLYIERNDHDLLIVCGYESQHGLAVITDYPDKVPV